MPLRKFRYKREGTEFGPVDESVMRTLVASGELDPSDPVYSDELGEWVAAETVFIFPKRRTAYQVPPQLAHPPTKTELSMPWIGALLAVLALCAGVLVWSIHSGGDEPVQQVAPSAVIAPARKKIVSDVDKAIEEMKQHAVPRGYDDLVAALESPPAPPSEFDRPSELIRWWTAYTQLHDRYWQALTQVQQQRVPVEILGKWRAPWTSWRLLVREVKGEVREVRPTAKVPDISGGEFVVELQQGSVLNCVLYGTEEEVARISKGGAFQAADLRVIKIADGEYSRLYPEERHVIIWYVRDQPLEAR